MADELGRSVWLSEEDCFNIVNWWMHSVEMEEKAERGPIRDSERNTINRIEAVKRKISHRRGSTG